MDCFHQTASPRAPSTAQMQELPEVLPDMGGEPHARWAVSFGSMMRINQTKAQRSNVAQAKLKKSATGGLLNQADRMVKLAASAFRHWTLG